MSDEATERQTIVDEFGKLIQRKSSRGRWMDHKRILETEDGSEYEVYLETRGPFRAKTKDFINAIKGGEIRIRMNDMNNRIEVNESPITDPQEAIILNFLRDIGLKGERKMHDALLQAAHTNRYHPIKNYLNDLEWNGEDHLTALLSHFRFSQKTQDIAPVFFRKWLVGAVAKIMGGGQNFMLVLDGPQRVGKSYLCRWICPEHLQREYFIEGAVQPDDKDSYIRLMSKWIWEVGELQATTRRADMEALKDFITRQVVTVRMPYGKYDVTKPAAASLIGTINESGGGFLGDMTGTRRFGIVETDKIDWSYTEIDVGQLWAQAMSLYEDGYEWLLTEKEREMQEEVNREYEMPSTVGEIFYRYFEIEEGAEADPNDFIPSSEIISELKLRGLESGRDRVHYMELASIMRRENATKIKVDNVNGYCGIRKKTQAEVVGKNNGDIRL
jgi:predicted P-loop ATPase